jgi:type I restriction enzyme, S subunit
MYLCDQLEAARAEREQCRDNLVAASLQGLNQPAEEEDTFREHARFTFNNLPRITTRAAHIKQLRQTILNLAVRGKLVEQDPSDEKPKGIKRQDESAAPFNLPNNWEWIQIGDQLNLLNGIAFKSTDWGTTGLRIVRIQNLNNPNAAFNFCDPVISRERSLIDDGSFLISWSGTPGTSFGAFIWERGPAVLNQHIFRCDFKTQSFIASFLRLAINGRLDEMISKAHGGVGLQHITKGRLEALLIPLPPLAEQHRIVAKVEELMNLCDQMEAQITVTEQDSRRFLESVLADALAPAGDLSAEAQVA